MRGRFRLKPPYRQGIQYHYIPLATAEYSIGPWLLRYSSAAECLFSWFENQQTVYSNIISDFTLPARVAVAKSEVVTLSVAPSRHGDSIVYQVVSA